MHVTGHEGGQGGGASPGDLKLSGVTLGAKEKVGGDRVENQELEAEPLQDPSLKLVATTRPAVWTALSRRLLSCFPEHQGLEGPTRSQPLHLNSRPHISVTWYRSPQLLQGPMVAEASLRGAAGGPGQMLFPHSGDEAGVGTGAVLVAQGGKEAWGKRVLGKEVDGAMGAGGYW